MRQEMELLEALGVVLLAKVKRQLSVVGYLRLTTGTSGFFNIRTP